MRRVKINPEVQGAMFASPEEISGGAVVEVEGGYYRAPTPVQGEAPELTPEQAVVLVLRAEDTALDFLDRAADTATRISTMSRGQFALRRAGVDQTKQASLGHSIEASQATERRFRRVAKAQFGLSIGIETEEEKSVRFVESESREREIIKVVAKDPEQQDELSRRHREFLGKYKDRPKAREARREEIAARLKAQETTAA